MLISKVFIQQSLCPFIPSAISHVLTASDELLRLPSGVLNQEVQAILSAVSSSLNDLFKGPHKGMVLQGITIKYLDTLSLAVMQDIVDAPALKLFHFVFPLLTT